MASFLKISTLIAIVSTLQTTLAAPPACLLACVAKVEKGSKCSGLNDLSCICTTKNSDVEKCLKEICPNGDADTAISAFKSSCSGYSSQSSSSESESESASSEGSSASASASASSSAGKSSNVEASTTKESSSAKASSSAAGSSEAVSSATETASTEESSSAA
ncbi:hypothetical protein MEW_04999, partial [Candida albicans P60002]